MPAPTFPAARRPTPALSGIFAATIAFAAPLLLCTPEVRPAEVRDIVHQSKALGRETTYTVVLPNAATMTPPDSGTSFPVAFLLHGYSGNHRDWADRTSITILADRHQSIFVLPDGDFGSWWIDSPLIPQSRFSTYLTKDLLEDVERRFPVRRDRAGRAILGLSMGGHGATVNAMLRPDLFASASSMSGILTLLVYPAKWGIPKVLPHNDRAALRSHSFIGLAERLRTMTAEQAPAILFDCGTSDTAAIEANRRTHEALTNRAIHHVYREFPGIHSWDYWNARLPEHLEFHAAVRHGLDGKGPVVESGPRPAERWRDIYTSRTLAYEKENEEKWIPRALDTATPATSRPIVLLGSSTFEIKDIRNTLPGYEVAYRGISADRLGRGERGLLHRLYCSAIDLNPRAIFILNGTNDLGSLSEPDGPTLDELLQIYEEIARRLRDALPETRIYLVSLSPLRDNYLRLVPHIQPFNNGVKQIAQRLGGRVTYVDQWTLLHDGDGVLRPEYSRDGLHLNAAGYEILGKAMRKALTTDGIFPTD